MMSKYPAQNILFAVVIGTPCLAAIFVALRIYARRRTGATLGWDDYVIFLALVLSIALIYPSVEYTYMWHMGMHIWEVDQRYLLPDLGQAHLTQVLVNMFNIPIVPLAKASMVLLLLKVGWVITPIRYTLYCIFAFNLGAGLASEFSLFFVCPAQPGYDFSKSTVYGGLSCLSAREAGKVNVFMSFANILTDVLIFPIPTFLMYHLRSASIKARLSIASLFALSLGTTAIGAVRTYKLYDTLVYQTAISDWTYPIYFCLSHAENNAAIIMACVPTLRYLFSNPPSKARDNENQAPRSRIFQAREMPGDSLLMETLPGRHGEAINTGNGNDSTGRRNITTERELGVEATMSTEDLQDNKRAEVDEIAITPTTYNP